MYFGDNVEDACGVCDSDSTNDNYCAEVGCPDGYVADCSGEVECAPASWIGDGWCDGEDQAFGYDLTCYENDGGDCVSVTIGDSCADGAGVIDCNEQCVSTWYVDAWLGDAWCDSMFNCSEWNYDNGDCGVRSDEMVAEAKKYSKDYPMFPTKTEDGSRLDGECVAYDGPDTDECGVCFGDGVDADDDGVCDDVDECVGDYDPCGICNGDGTWCLTASITLGAATTTSLEVLYDSPLNIGGFQFNISGANVTGGSGGAAEANGFQVSAGGSTVLGFAFDGSVVPAGSGVLTNLAITATDFTGCISDIVLSCLLYTSPSPRDS